LNHANNQINGRADVVNFFPVALNLTELYTPTIAREMPMKIKRWDRWASQACHRLLPQTLLFASRIVDSATNATQGSKDCLHQTEHPNALPASWRCPGQPRMLFGIFFNSQHPVRLRSWMRLPQLCGFMLKQFNFPSTAYRRKP
jgi:hypothetical protein